VTTLSQILSLSQLPNINTTISQDFKLAVNELKNIVDSFPKPFVFLKTDNTGISSNINADVLAVPGTPVPPGHKGLVEDFNLNFSTAAGTVQIVVMQNRQIVNRIVRNINADTSGIGKTVLDEGQYLAIVGQTAGAGQFTSYCSGVLVKQVIP